MKTLTRCVLMFAATAVISFATPQPNIVSANPPKNSETQEKKPDSLTSLDIHRAQLKNGLRIVLNPNPALPIIALAVYYDVGSRDEEKGRSGFAHLFEHMMFQGSANIEKGEHFKIINSRGGSFNGTTSVDRTNYYETLPSHELELGLWMEADRMRSLNITQATFENQRQTVMEERRQRYDNQAYVLSSLRINELAYRDYFPYAHSTIGDMEDLKRAPLSAVQAFFDRYYAPNNAIVSLSGDFEPEHALKLIEKHFGSIPSRPVTKPNLGTITPQTAERKDSIRDRFAQFPAFHYAFHIPRPRTKEHYPLELLAIILGDGSSSRLYQKLVKKSELLQSIDISTDNRRGPDLFSVWAIGKNSRAIKQAKQQIDKEIDRIARFGVTKFELEKSKNRLRAAHIFALEHTLHRAMRLAEFEMYWGNANLLKTQLNAYNEVTSKDIQRVAKQYLIKTNRTVLDVLPVNTQEKKQ